ncbi:hypothetical protein JL107_18325 [Nakamurella flavida]|uniref:GNAT family N-acetyltransferase n=1 Tax=Nakamurella flavida TaxID=363630 RepID=A0A938YN48_9ACTN|nr:hypothetical protein [Nakamurella flavida]MBM9475930.1 hypothetical protein [Nakamurella flavida]MBM9478410.1 hypothetical protein [Nakamurella flavida]MDP9777783.1 N-acetylglutamate synthase-like GNAT family acetyltransferase [Nakamurella flavida]
MALADVALVWARGRGLERVVVTTYRDVPWNAPYYRRLGFHDIPDAELPDWLRAVRRREHALGLDAWPRVCLTRPLRP